jgi:hypothetical protein
MDWVPIPVWEDDPDNGFVNEYKIGRRIIVRPDLLNSNRTGTIIGWGRAATSHQHGIEMHGEVVTCQYGRGCDYLVDSEGPVIRYDDRLPGDETLDWYPGQSMGCLEVLPEIPEGMESLA